MTLTTSPGDHDVWTANRSASALQSVDNTDFDVVARFLSTPTEQFQMQGILVREDVDSWIRFDLQSNGSELHAFASVTLDGIPGTRIDVPVIEGTASFLRVTRSGDFWSFLYSNDGANWTLAGSFQQALSVTEIGPFAGSTTSAPGFTAEVDYFFDAASPPPTEDGLPLPLIASGPHVLTGLVAEASVLSHEASYSLSDGTFAFTITADAIDGRRFLLSKDSSGFDSGGHAGIYIEDGTVVARFQDTTTTYVAATSALITTGQIHHIAVSFGTAGLKIYVDGIEQASNAYTGGLLGNAEPIVIGANQWASGNGVADDLRDAFNGEISEAQLYGTALGTADIASLSANALNASPVAIDDALTTDQGVALLIDAAVDLLANDTDANGDTLSVTAFTQPANGTLVDNGNGTYTYTPNSSFIGTDTFSYTVNDGNGGTDTSTVAITISDPANTPPTASADTYNTDEDTVLNIAAATGVLANDTDLDGDALTLSVISGPSNGALTLNGDGEFNYTPNTNFNGTDSFTYEVNDGRGGIASATAAIEVNPINDAPLAGDDTLSAASDTPLIINVDTELLANDTDIDGDALIAAISIQPTNGTLIDNADGTLTYTPNTGFVGSDTFAYTVSDGNGGTAQASATITVTDSSLPSPLLESGPHILTGLVAQAPVLTHETGYSLSNGTFAFTFTADAIDGRRFLLSKDSSGFDNGGHVGIYIEDGAIVARFQDTTTTYVATTSALITAGQAHHVAVSFGTAGLKVYVDGAEQASDLYTGGLLGNDEPIVIGANQWASGNGIADKLRDAFDGEISEAKLYDTALGTAEIASLSANALNVSPVALDDTFTTDQGVALLINAAVDLLANDTDGNNDALSITAFTQPTNGTLVDNGNGTYTYTPMSNFIGTDTFSYTVDDGNGGTDIAVASIAVSTPQAGIVSDDFSSASLQSFWTIGGPAGTTSSLNVNGTDAYVSLSTPAGDFDVWTVNNSARAMQAIDDADFQVEAGFLSTPSAQYQIQGILVEEDADTWIRFDTFSDGSALNAFAAVTLDGSPATQFNVEIPGGTAPFIRVDRAGDIWTMSYSTDGSAWSVAGSFTQALNVSSVGPFGASTGNAPGFTAQVDYFFDASAPPATEDDIGTNVVPTAVDDVLATGANTALTVSIATDLLSNDSDPNGDPISLVSFTQPTNGSLIDNGNGTLTYTPAQDFVGTDTFTYTISDGSSGTDTASASITISPPQATIGSDDFSGTTLQSFWTVGGPAGTSSSLDVNGAEAYLSLSTPTGDFDVWSVNNSARAMQAITDSDFQVEVGFLSTPNARYQMQGILVEEDADTWIRFDTYHDGTDLNAFAAVTLDGSPTAQFSVALPVGTAPFIRVDRAGDDWMMSYSTDGAVWTVAGSFTQALNVSSIGPFGASTGNAPGFTAQVDYFFDSSAPPLTEDGVSTNNIPFAAGDFLSTGANTALAVSIATDLLANDSDSDGDPLSLESFTQPTNGSLIDNGNGTLTYTPAQGFIGTDTFTYTVNDGNGGTNSAIASIAVALPDSGIISDDFASSTLNPAWSFLGIVGSAQLGTSATDGFVEIESPAGVPVSASDFLTTPRLLQSAANEDFQISAGFLTEPNQTFSEHGLLVVEDDQNFVRFDIAYTSNDTLRLIVGVIDNGSTNFELFQSISSGTVRDFRITRTGDLWNFETSADGLTWISAHTTTHAMNVSQVGVFTGSAPKDGVTPGYTAQLDYFENTATPIVNEDGTITGINSSPIALDDGLATDQDVALLIDGASDLIANDTDADNDSLTISSFTQPANGTLVDNGNGTFTYTPTSGFVGTDTFSYTVNDGNGGSDTANVSIAVSSPQATIISDDFSGATLQSFWTVGGPAGTTNSLDVNGPEAYLTLSTPTGNFDIWTVNNSARALQAITDSDFQVEAGFLSTPSARFQIQGILVEEDSDTWIRFDTFHDGSDLNAFAAVTLNGSPSAQFNVEIPGGTAPFIRVDRAGDVWTMSYSTDGTVWTVAGSFTQALNVSSVGPFAASAADAPGFTAQVDYFFDSSAPPSTEDGIGINTVPIAVDDALSIRIDTALSVNVTTDLLANDSDPNGDPLSLDSFTQPTNGTLVDNGNGTLTYTPTQGFSGTDTFTYSISDGNNTDTADVNVQVRDLIDVWYGTEQTFGLPGEAQEWINILGNVSATEVASLAYSLNGGADRALTFMPDGRRLERDGDFNIDIRYSELDGTQTDDVVTIKANLVGGGQVTQDVLVDYESGTIWPANYSIDWSSVVDIQDAVQVVDGLWSHTSAGARPVETGYDRVITIGDQTWDNYQIDFSLTFHDVTAEDPEDVHGGGFGLAMLWNGHGETGTQPNYGFQEAAYFFRGPFNSPGIELHAYDNWSNVLGGTGPFDFQVDSTYDFSVAVEQINGLDRQYSLSVWESGTTQPTDWMVQVTQSFTQPITGGFAFIPHFWDFTVGNIQVNEITGSDIIQGRDSADIINAVDVGSANPGAGEIDILVGGSGADQFVLGESGSVFYNDGDSQTNGDQDYAIIWDLDRTVDTVQLAGQQSDYQISASPPELESGSALYLVEASGEDELIAVFRGENSLELTDPLFQFDIVV
ncbi:MAG: cadherin-like domain-containing protein [Pseudomonadota bacterium]